MLDNLGIALQITLIGMGLVFAAIVLLWLVMVVLVRLTADRVRVEPEAEMALPPDDQSLLRQQAAAAAVAVALQGSPRMPRHPIPPTATTSAWQSVMRGRQLKQRGRIR